MQNPPPGPPPGGQPPNYQPPGSQPPGYQPPPYQQPPGYQPVAGGGVDKKTGAILSYLLGWVTGIIFLFVGKNDPDVKYHAAQSLVFFGGMTVVFWAIRILGSFLPWYVGVILGLITFALLIYSFVVWVMCLVRASSGGGARFQIPLVGNLVTPYAEQIANAVN
jgi:uncharacterized membrane protein